MRFKVVAWCAVAAASVASVASAQTRSVSGTVRDSLSREGVAVGAVVVKGTGIGTNIRSNGQFA